MKNIIFTGVMAITLLLAVPGAAALETNPVFFHEEEGEQQEIPETQEDLAEQQSQEVGQMMERHANHMSEMREDHRQEREQMMERHMEERMQLMMQENHTMHEQNEDSEENESEMGLSEPE